MSIAHRLGVGQLVSPTPNPPLKGSCYAKVNGGQQSTAMKSIRPASNESPELKANTKQRQRQSRAFNPFKGTACLRDVHGRGMRNGEWG